MRQLPLLDLAIDQLRALDPPALVTTTEYAAHFVEISTPPRATGGEIEQLLPELVVVHDCPEFDRRQLPFDEIVHDGVTELFALIPVTPDRPRWKSLIGDAPSLANEAVRGQGLVETLYGEEEKLARRPRSPSSGAVE